MSDYVRIVEVGPRDGLQNEKQSVSTADKIELINRLSATGLRSIEATSFVSPKWIPQLADAAEVYAGIQRRPGIHYPVLVPNEQGYDRARAVGVEEVAVFTAASEAFNRTNTNAGIDESLARFEPILRRAAADGVRVRGYVSTVLGCPYQGEVPLADVVRVARALHQMGCYEISLGDTIGVGTPRKARAMLQAVAAEIPMEALAVHFHDTYGQAVANIATCRKKACAWSTVPSPGPVAARMPRVPAATSPAKTWSTCCGAWAWRAAWTCRHWPRPAAGWPACSAAPPPAAPASARSDRLSTRCAAPARAAQRTTATVAASVRIGGSRTCRTVQCSCLPYVP